MNRRTVLGPAVLALTAPLVLMAPAVADPPVEIDQSLLVPTTLDSSFAPFDCQQRKSFTRATSPTLSSVTTFSSSSSGLPAPLPRRSKKKKRVSSTDKMLICRLHEENPDLRQQDIADQFKVERSTVSKILKEKDRWLSLPRPERRPVYRLRYAAIQRVSD